MLASLMHGKLAQPSCELQPVSIINILLLTLYTFCLRFRFHIHSSQGAKQIFMGAVDVGNEVHQARGYEKLTTILTHSE